MVACFMRSNFVFLMYSEHTVMEGKDVLAVLMQSSAF